MGYPWGSISDDLSGGTNGKSPLQRNCEINYHISRSIHSSQNNWGCIRRGVRMVA